LAVIVPAATLLRSDFRLWMRGDDVPYLRIIGRHEAAGDLLDAYLAMADRPMPSVYQPDHGDAPGIIRAHSLDAELLRRTFAVSGSLSNDALPWHSRELVNSVTSRENECFY
jgi:alkylhydroperoxidase family enzyme